MKIIVKQVINYHLIMIQNKVIKVKQTFHKNHQNLNQIQIFQILIQ